MKGYREAFYPPAKCSTPRPRSPGAEDRDSTPRSGEQDEQERMGIAKEPLFTAAPEGDEGDELEMMALEEMKREEAARRPPLEEDGPPEVEEEDEWEGLYD